MHHDRTRKPRSESPHDTVITWSVAETARQTGLSAKFLYRAAADQLLPSYKIGRSRRFRPDDVRRFLESCREDPRGVSG